MELLFFFYYSNLMRLGFVMWWPVLLFLFVVFPGQRKYWKEFNEFLLIVFAFSGLFTLFEGFQFYQLLGDLSDPNTAPFQSDYFLQMLILFLSLNGFIPLLSFIKWLREKYWYALTIYFITWLPSIVGYVLFKQYSFIQMNVYLSHEFRMISGFLFVYLFLVLTLFFIFRWIKKQFHAARQKEVV